MSRIWTYNDGGRAAAGYKGDAGDCVTRATAIATRLPYQTVYDALWAGQRRYAERHTDRIAQNIARRGASPREGVFGKICKPYLESLGWRWVPTMKIGTGCTVHLSADELPSGRLVVKVSRHLTAVIDGVIHDIDDPSRDGTRCVYGYYQEGTPVQRPRLTRPEK